MLWNTLRLLATELATDSTEISRRDNPVSLSL